MRAARIHSQRQFAADRAHWRRAIRRELAWFLVVKFTALTLLWFLFFSPVHRHHVGGDVASRQFGVAANGRDRSTVSGRMSAQKEKTRD